MTRLKISLGALMACAALFAVLGASNAAASTLHECKELGQPGATAQRYSDSNCATKNNEGKFQTVPISTPTPVAVTATQTSDFVLSAAPLGIKNKITCKKMMSEGATAKNEEVEGKMRVSGGASVTAFSECVVNEPAGCTVAEPIKTKEITSVTEDLAGEVMRTKYTPKTGTEFVTITLGNCGLLNGGHTVNGVARSESEGTTAQKFTTTSGSELTFFGAAATLTGSYHLATGEGTTLLALETP